MAAIDLELKAWPVVITTCHPGVMLDRELERYLNRFRAEIRQRTGVYVSVVDLRQSPILSPSQRRIVASGMGSEEASQKQCIAAALVFDSMLLRGVLTAIFWLRKPAHEVRVFATLPDALTWSRDSLTRHSARDAR